MYILDYIIIYIILMIDYSYCNEYLIIEMSIVFLIDHVAREIIIKIIIKQLCSDNAFRNWIYLY